MPLTPQAQAVMDLMATVGVELDPNESPEQVRATIEQFGAAAPPGDRVHRVEDRVAPPGPDGCVPVRVYWPSDETNLPVLLWMHGGGWTLGNLETADRTCRALTNAVGCIVVSVDYRLAPEHRFPAAVEDCLGVALGAGELAESIGGDPRRVAIGGDSAGGNLAAVTTLLIRDAEARAGDRDVWAPRFCFQVLVYPAVEVEYETPSMVEHGTGYFLTLDALHWFYGHYLGHAIPEQWMVSPLLAPDLAGVPPAFVLTAEFDPLRDQGQAYAKRLADAGVPVDARVYEGVFHGFFGMHDAIDVSREAFDDAVAALRGAFGT